MLFEIFQNFLFAALIDQRGKVNQPPRKGLKYGSHLIRSSTYSRRISVASAAPPVAI